LEVGVTLIIEWTPGEREEKEREGERERERERGDR
jgi:hypothetical protein